MKSLFENLNKHLDTDIIEEFRDILRNSLDRNLKKLETKHENLSVDDVLDPRDLPDYRNHIEDQMYFNCEVRNLGAILCIMTLYRQVELHIKKVLGIYFPKENARKYSSAPELIKAFPWIADLDNYDDYNNLRTLNNAIKHEGKTAQHDNRFDADLDETYELLAHKIKIFITALVKSASEKSHRFTE